MMLYQTSCVWYSVVKLNNHIVYGVAFMIVTMLYSTRVFGKVSHLNKLLCEVVAIAYRSNDTIPYYEDLEKGRHSKWKVCIVNG